MGARADFRCDTCQETMELPLAAAQCPVCRGPLARQFLTPPQVITQAVAPLVDRLVEPQYEHHRRITRAAAPVKTSVGDAKGVFGLLDAQGRLASRAVAVPVVRRLGLPQPGPDSKSG